MFFCAHEPTPPSAYALARLVATADKPATPPEERIFSILPLLGVVRGGSKMGYL